MNKLILWRYICTAFVVLFICSCASNLSRNYSPHSVYETITSENDPPEDEMQPIIPSDINNSPENVIKTFISAVKSGDFIEMATPFAIKDYIEGYNPDRLKEGEVGFFAQPTYDELFQKVYKQIYSFLLGFRISYEDEDAFDALNNVNMESLLDPQQYETLHIVRIDIPEQDEARHAEIISEEHLGVRLSGADGWDYRTALLSLNGETYYCGFSFLVYNGRYLIESLHCDYAIMMDYNLTLLPCPEEEYIRIISDLP